MFQALSSSLKSAAALAARLFDLTVEKAPAQAPKPNGNGHHAVAVKFVPVKTDVDENEEFEQGQCPALGLDQVVAQAAAQGQLVETKADQAAVDLLAPVPGNTDLDVLVAAMANSGFEAPALVPTAPAVEIETSAAEAHKAEAEVVEAPAPKPVEAKPVVAKKPAQPVDTRPTCKLQTCGERFTPPKGYTEGYCRKCHPDGWAFAEGRKAEAPTPSIRVCSKADCLKEFTPPARYPFAAHCPDCHAKDVAARKALEAKRAEEDKKLAEQRRLHGATEAQNKEEARLKAEAAKQARLQAEGCPSCKTCHRFFEPVYAGAPYCQPCAREYKRKQDEAYAKAQADHKAKLAADKALAERGVLTESERARRFEELKTLFVAGKDMPEGTSYTRTGTQLVFVQETKEKHPDGSPKKLSVSGHCPLTPCELADAEEARVKAEAAKRKLEAERAEAERTRKALEAKKKELGEKYLEGTLPEEVTALVVTEQTGKKGETKTLLRISFADGSPSIDMPVPVKETKDKSKKDVGKKGKKNNKK